VSARPDLPVIVVGAGGHGAVVADALLAVGATLIAFTDAAPTARGRMVFGLPVLGGDDEVLGNRSPQSIVLANGIAGTRGTALRRQVQSRLEASGWRFVGVCHPGAVVSRFASLGAGVQVLAGAIVQPGARLGDGCIVNTAAVVEHDCVLDAQVHVAPRALLCGGVRVGAGAHVGAGAVVRQGIVLGEACVVGAGAVVVRDVAGGEVVAGVPARPRATPEQAAR